MSCFSQCSTTGVTKAVVCAILSVVALDVVDVGFLSGYLSVQHHITINKMY